MCLKEEHVEEMRRCIKLDLECAVICNTAAQLMSMNSEFSLDICEMCVEVCSQCAEECGRHDDDHCQECAEACSDCAEECKVMLL